MQSSIIIVTAVTQGTSWCRLAVYILEHSGYRHDDGQVMFVPDVPNPRDIGSLSRCLPHSRLSDCFVHMTLPRVTSNWLHRGFVGPCTPGPMCQRASQHWVSSGNTWRRLRRRGVLLRSPDWKLGAGRRRAEAINLSQFCVFYSYPLSKFSAVPGSCQPVDTMIGSPYPT
jgi:hypothetical protein